MPWTPNQAIVRAENRARKRRGQLADKRLMELRAILSQATQALENGFQPDPGMDEATGLHPRDPSTGGKRIYLRSLNGHTLGQHISKRRYFITVKAFGYRVARELAFQTRYYSLAWPQPKTEKDRIIVAAETVQELEKHAYGL